MILGLDVGGTNTDVVFLSEKGVQKHVKVPTQPDNLFKSVLSGFTLILEGVDPGRIKRVVISTTLTTNAIVQQTVTPVGMIVSAGPGIDPENFRTGDQYYAVAGSINHRGREIEPINEMEIQRVGEKFKKAGIEYVGIVSKFCVRNPSHEILIERILNNQFKHIFLGHHVSGNLNFPRRIATTYMNAAVYPLHKEFFRPLNNPLRKWGLPYPFRSSRLMAAP